MIDVNIQEQEKKYSVIFDNNKISNLMIKIKEKVQDKKFVVVISQKVFKLYGKLLNLNKNIVFILKDGEKEKNFNNYKKILTFCFKHNLAREDYIIAIGGGVVGDITGFVASTYMRGINLIHIPTTLLACVDSSIGGKVAINTSFGKNLVGTFYQPKLVIINTKFLKTLNLNLLKSGIGEIIKYAFIEKSCGFNEELNILNLLNENYKQILNLDTRILTRLIEYCIKLKISIVMQDEKEKGLRRILNFGHTFGHAIERYTKYKKYTHGECIIWGIKFVFDLALKNNLIDNDYYYLMTDLLKRFDYKETPNISLQKLLPIMKRDKKCTSEYIRFILPVGYLQVKDFLFNDLFTIS